jgi:hypothetical protein
LRTEDCVFVISVPDASQNFDYGFTYIDDGNVEGFDQVEVTVIDKKSQAQFSKTFKVWRQGGSFCVA